MTDEYLSRLLEQISTNVTVLQGSLEKIQTKLDDMEDDFRDSLQNCQRHSETIHDRLGDRTSALETLVAEMVGCNRGKRQYSGSVVAWIAIATAAIVGLAAAYIQKGGL